MSKTHFNSKSECPKEIFLWQGHEVSECLGYQKFLPEDYAAGEFPVEDRWYKLSRKLWNFTNNAERPVPLGGDGSPDRDGNPTVETPAEQMDYRIESDDNAATWWSHLTDVEQAAIVAACDEEFAAWRA